MITTNTGAKKLESSDNWREIFPNPGTGAAGAHNASVDAADRIQPEIAPIINGKQCALGASAGDFVLLRNSTITGKTDGAYQAAKAIPANTDIDATYLGSEIGGGIANALNSNLTQYGEYTLLGIANKPSSDTDTKTANLSAPIRNFRYIMVMSTYDDVGDVSYGESILPKHYALLHNAQGNAWHYSTVNGGVLRCWFSSNGTVFNVNSRPDLQREAPNGNKILVIGIK